MFGDNPFAVPISSFQRPVPLVLVDPDDEPDYNVCFRKEWLPYILGSLQQLWLQTTWDTTDPDALALQQDRAKQLTSLFMNECPMCEAELPTVGGCVSFPPDSSIISWKPQNPFTEPDYIPPGYIAVPFLEVTAGSLISFFPGAEVGDVVSGWLSMPVPLPDTAENVAQFRVHVKGAGVVELHMLRFPGGGAAIITADNEIGSIRTINLNKDLVQAPPETVGEIVVEIPFTTLGEHHVDVSFAPRFNDELVFVSYGGGLRSVVLCGFDETIEQQIAERAKKGAISVDEDKNMAIRVDPDRCYMLQFECSPGQWVDMLDTRCGAIAQGTQPTDGAALLDGECREWDVVLSANERWLLPLQVNAQDVLQVTGTVGAWNDGTFLWNCADGRGYVAGGCASDDAANVGDPLQTVNHMRLIMNLAGTYTDAFNVTTAVPDGVVDGQVEFQANDGSLNDNSGKVSFHVKVCRPVAAPSSVALTYDYGTGPSSLLFAPGEEKIVTFTGTAIAGYTANYGVNIHFSVPMDITVLAETGYVNTGTGGGVYSAIYNPYPTAVHELHSPPNFSLLDMPPNLVGDLYGGATGSGSVAFTVTLKLKLP